MKKVSLFLRIAAGMLLVVIARYSLPQAPFVAYPAGIYGAFLIILTIYDCILKYREQ